MSTAVAEHAERLWNAVTTGDEYTAGDVVVQALGAGTDPESVLLDVIGAVQRRVGQEWAANRLTVAQEHAATAINDRVIATFGYLLKRPEPHLGRVTVACVDGEWHAMPARLLSEVLRLRGFQVDYLGAQVPAPHLVAHLHRTGPDAVALSGSLATRLPTAHATITACQATATPVIAGGAAFGHDGRYARLLGAEAWAPDARAAADRLARPLPRPHAGHQPLDDLPHLADQEYTLVTRSSGRLVKTVLAGLAERIPAMRTYTDLQRQYTAEDLAHIVEYLATALYVGDEELFTGFLTWTAGILTARGVPAASLVPALELLEAELRDFPRATGLLRAAHTRLAEPAAGSELSA
ncbi:cobalamin B12-binding domain-containing protein [Amycolatopsis eburnea]|uniref:Cobalamin-binding protein n=1 Tax=Amycolatopsis eburnea TaxID=2267691 RepID=A0A427SV88_9PSEU|nr:cobalamin-dependent protein [Amycolatopsis eburnea]RSD07911.1 cobalamin-binding protein [Amycolatopsis eburnea]